MNRRAELAATATERMNRIRQPGRYAAPPRALVATTSQRDEDYVNVLRNHLHTPTDGTVEVLARYAANAQRADQIRASREAT